MKQNNTVLLISDDIVVHNLELNFITDTTFNNEDTLLLRLLDMVIFNSGELAFGPTESDVGSKVFDQVICNDIGRAAFFDQDTLVVILLNEVAVLRVFLAALLMDLFLESGTSVNDIVKSDHSIVELTINDCVLEKSSVFFRNLEMVFLIWKLRNFQIDLILFNSTNVSL